MVRGFYFLISSNDAEKKKRNMPWAMTNGRPCRPNFCDTRQVAVDSRDKGSESRRYPFSSFLFRCTKETVFSASGFDLI